MRHFIRAALVALCLATVLPLAAFMPVAAQDAGQLDARAVARAEEMRSARAPSSEVAQEMQSAFRLNAETSLRVLAAVGYPAEEVATVGLGTLRLAPDAMAGVLRSARVSPERVATSLAGTGLRAEATAGAFKSAGFTAAETARALSGGLKVEPYEMYMTLTGVGFTAADVGAAVEEEGIPLEMGCLDPSGHPVPCGNFVSGNNAPVMGQVSWSPQGSGEVGTVVTFESTNIPSVDVLLAGQPLEVVEITPSRVRARLPATPVSGALAFRRQSDNVIGVIEDWYGAIAAPTDPMAGVDWPAAAQAALEGTLEAADEWIMGSRFQASHCKVMAVSAIGPPGVLANSEGFRGSIRDRLLQEGVPEELASAWQGAVEAAFLEWANKVTIPGLPWYPAFAAFPGPEAIPMPNLPMPLGVLASGGLYAMTPPGLAERLNEALPGAGSSPAQAAIAAFATNLGASFSAFLAASSVMNVVGEGPVPTFAPPTVPVGPVVAGSCASPGMWSSVLPSGMNVSLPDLTGG